MSKQNKATLKEANDAVTRGDYEGFLSFCTDDTEWTFVDDRVLSGKEAVRRYMAETYIEPPQFDLDNIIAEGDFVVAIGNIGLKDKEGNTTQYTYCDVWKFLGGKMDKLTAFVMEPNIEG